MLNAIRIAWIRHGQEPAASRRAASAGDRGRRWAGRGRVVWPPLSEASLVEDPAVRRPDEHEVQAMMIRNSTHAIAAA